MNKKFNEKVQKEKETEDQIEICENHRKSISINENDVTKSDYEQSTTINKNQRDFTFDSVTNLT